VKYYSTNKAIDGDGYFAIYFVIKKPFYFSLANLNKGKITLKYINLCVKGKKCWFFGYT